MTNFLEISSKYFLGTQDITIPVTIQIFNHIIVCYPLCEGAEIIISFTKCANIDSYLQRGMLIMTNVNNELALSI